MAKVVYRGRAATRVLSAADLKKVDIEGFSRRSFNRGEVVEVDQEVGEALVSHREIFGVGFELVEEDEPEEPETREVVDDSTDSEEAVARRGGRTTKSSGGAGRAGAGSST